MRSSDYGPVMTWSDMTPNQLREILYEAGVDYPDDATKDELIELVRNLK
nr:MAG TPA: hypothetical protein [Caudoviricetes sp.]